jgi:signal peptidase I
MADKLKSGSSGTSIKSEGEFAPTGNRPKTLDELRAKGTRDSFTVTNKKVTKAKKKESTWRSLLVALLVALVIRTFFVEAFRIPTGSMKNTLLVGDYLFVNKLAYFFKSPKYIPWTSIEIPSFSIPTGGIDRGDVMVFEYPGDRDLVVPREKNVNYIKRVIGLPGDVIEIANKQVYVNGKAMQNPAGMRYREGAAPKEEVQPHIFPKNTPWNPDWFGPLRIPKKGDMIPLTKENLEKWEVFIEREGHRARFGPEGQIQIDGKESNSYVVERDYLWMMGDNRDDSEDSRFWGFMPVENVVGEALFIYWSWYNPPSSGMGDGYDPEEDQRFHIRWNRLLNGVD